MLIMKESSLDEMLSIYEQYAVHDFPASELKQKSHIAKMFSEGLYKGFSFFHGELLVAYSWFYASSSWLFDYFSVLPAYRSLGYGSEILALLKKTLAGITLLGEVEDPDFASGFDDMKIRNRRIHFYERNGMYISDIRTKVLDDHYKIISNKFLSDDIIREKIYQLYQDIFGSAFFRANIVIE